MKALTSLGKQYIEEIASKYNLKNETVESLLKAVIGGNGTMAQFNIAELGGSGQWMKGGMTMVGDMFNNSLKSIVDKLCNELSELVSTNVLYEEAADRPTAERPITDHSNLDRPTASEPSVDRFSSQHQGNGFSSVSSGSWPAVFGNPTASGSQNNFRYAYFAPVRRLVIEENGKQIIYDTKHHHITGISQQQGSGNSYKFTSQEGQVDLGSLQLISEPGEQTQPTPEIAYDVTSTADLRSETTDRSPADRSTTDRSPQDIIIATIEKVNILFEKGQISEEEFKAKKQELLSRL
ncbi:SHOCT domain-containing protein [Dyadobacter chenwenxiniae]|uniref:SHOCT domain-containing protein n=1 Tax=Dyadobacter chenwenxiniae TaxID=2906456 RepID=A0A9X1PIQ3_9BACT|nr:SHOCT domain-containing protein [Dyadobacter chenwenxiniae]MCF0061441.1 SHOCT domain-containing protein [Dyadobacter chenwenxiniae]UON81263.1 SHOCT domain-containing protein [Dyadobacter chenwenxiniae]